MSHFVMILESTDNQRLVNRSVRSENVHVGHQLPSCYFAAGPALSIAHKQEKNPYSVLITLELISAQALIQVKHSHKTQTLCFILTVRINSSNRDWKAFSVHIIKCFLLNSLALMLIVE